MSESSDTDVMDEAGKFRTMRSFSNWAQIKEILMKMAEGSMNSGEIIDALSTFKDFSHSSRFKKERIRKVDQFQNLIEKYNDDIPIIFCRIANFVLGQSSFSYPLFQQSRNFQHTFTKQQVLYLLCSMVLCLIPAQQYHNPQRQRQFCFQSDFSTVFQNSIYKTMSIIQYLKKELGNKHSYQQALTIKRKSLDKEISQVLKQHHQRPMSQFHMRSNEESIEQSYGQLKVDFANRFVGGGALGHGCVQEEIMFANHPQMHISQLLCEVMKNEEALLFIGFQKYNKNAGYGFGTTYAEKEDKIYEFDDKGRAKQYIIAIDALFEKKDSISQYKQINIKREIAKAYCGFSFDIGQEKKVVTGNWGCGAFGGNVQVKLLIQWIACTLAGKEIVYCPFGELEVINNQVIFDKIKVMKVGEVYQLLLRACRRVRNSILLPSQDEPKQKRTKSLKESKQIDFFGKLGRLLQVAHE